MELQEIKISYKTNEEKALITNSGDIYNLVMKSWDHELIEVQEEMKVIYLNRANRVIGIYPLSKGGLTGTVVDIKLIMSVALKCLASNVILVHNHPSGNLTASTADIEITKKVEIASNYFEMKLLDHLIVSTNGYFSFADEGLIAT